MVHTTYGRFVAIAALFLALPAAAQNYGPQTGYQPNPYQQPVPYQQPGSYQPNPYQPSPMPQAGPSGAAPSMVGTWSGQGSGQNGTVQLSDAYSADGRFMSVGRLPNGFLARFWGTYRATPVGPNQLRLETQLQGWLPREICQQLAGQQPQCQPSRFPTSDTSLVTFSSPNQFQSMSETSAGGMVNEMRDNQPALLQAQAPQRWTTIVQPSAAPAPGPSPVPGYAARSYPGPTPAAPRNACFNDDIQRNNCRYSGRLVTSGGCLQCVN